MNRSHKGEDLKSMKKNVEVTSFVCQHVSNASKPIQLAIKDRDGSWQFLCGKCGFGEGELKAESCHVVGLNHLVERDETLRQILDLKTGWCAERKNMKESWRLSPLPEE